jgi:hypothetical protein
MNVLPLKDTLFRTLELPTININMAACHLVTFSETAIAVLITFQ